MKHKGLIRSYEMEFAFLYRLSDLAVIVTFMLLLVLKDTNTSMDKTTSSCPSSGVFHFCLWRKAATYIAHGGQARLESKCSLFAYRG